MEIADIPNEDNEEKTNECAWCGAPCEGEHCSNKCIQKWVTE
jgi:hypothetical protein